MRHSTLVMQAVYKMVLDGVPPPEITRRTGVAYSTQRVWVKNRRGIDQEFNDALTRLGLWKSNNPTGRNGSNPDVMPLPGTAIQSDEAARALTDFAFFRHRYLGRRSTPWQEEAAASVNGWVTSPETEFIVVNCPPGSGKSTLFVMDIPLWLICRDRTIRILIGSSTGKLASQYTARIRRMLERTRPLPAAADREQAQGCLAADYGRFKPDVGADIWRREEFTVLAASDINDTGESAVEDKEPTCSAYGMDQEFLGARANLVVWDDLVTSKVLKSTDAVLNQQQWWSDEAETRVEPGGALVLQGQRLGANDLYRFALDQTAGVDEGEAARSRYRHIIYPAHFEDRCTGDHGREDSLGRLLESPKKAYPEGCLLDPWRLPWYGKSGLLTIQTNRAEKYRVVYQQEDVDPQNVLVLPIWIDGGRGKDGIEYPGCWDRYRGFANDIEDLPRGLSQPWYSIATVDPSPTNFWAVEWWLYHPASEQRFLLDIHRDRMDASDLHGWNANMGEFYGLMHDWQLRSRRLHVPITTWIVEQNAAQRWLLSTDAMKRWRAKYAVNILGHNTIAANKLDEQRGIESIGDRYRFGNVRLPGKKGNWTSPSAVVTQTIVREATRYPEKGTTDDCLMAQWFLEYHLPLLAKPRPDRLPQLPRPSWMKRSA